MLERVGKPTLSLLLKGGDDMNSVEKYIYDNLTSLVNNLGYSFYHIDYSKNRKEAFLRIFIEPNDSSLTMDIDACEKVSRACSEAFDNDNNFPIKDAYTLEVSSPGIERDLYTPEHYQRYIGEKIRVHLYKSIDNKKEFIAVLSSADNEGVKLNIDENTVELTYKEISKAQLYCDF